MTAYKFGEEIGYWEPDGGSRAVGSVNAPSSPIQPGWPDDGKPRFVVASVTDSPISSKRDWLVLDRAYAHRLVRETFSRYQAALACRTLNRHDASGVFDCDLADTDIRPGVLR